MNVNSPIGIFDSGMGGISVLKQIHALMPQENLLYFGDSAYAPYGEKSRAEITERCYSICGFFMRKKVKAIVIACNTASALALDAVRKEFKIPIIGVVAPGARAAREETINKKIGVIGTEATVKSEIYKKLIQAEDPQISVSGRACPLFVPLVEEGFAKHKITREVIDIYLSDMRESDIDTLILGCTHYPLLRSTIREYMGEKIHLVNPAYETAMDLKRLLEEEEMLRDTPVNDQEEHGEYSFYVSDAADKFKQFANSILPYDIETTKQINIEEY